MSLVYTHNDIKDRDTGPLVRGTTQSSDGYAVVGTFVFTHTSRCHRPADGGMVNRAWSTSQGHTYGDKPKGAAICGFIQQGGWEFITLGSYAGQAISGTQ